MWVLINNNVVTRQVFLCFMTFDFLLQVLIIICLYSTVGAVPSVSIGLIEALDYSNPLVIAIIVIVQATILTTTFSALCVLVFRQFSW